MRKLLLAFLLASVPAYAGTITVTDGRVSAGHTTSPVFDACVSGITASELMGVSLCYASNVFTNFELGRMSVFFLYPTVNPNPVLWFDFVFQPFDPEALVVDGPPLIIPFTMTGYATTPLTTERFDLVGQGQMTVSARENVGMPPGFRPAMAVHADFLQVPEPASVFLLGAGLILLAARKSFLIAR